MYVALQIAAALAVVSEPFLPFTSNKLKNMLNIASTPPNEQKSWEDVSEKDVLIPSGHTIGKGELLFSKIEDKTVVIQLEKLAATKITNEGLRGN